MPESCFPATRQYTGLDRFGRVIDQYWLNTNTSTALDRFQYTYDADGNTLYENNLVNSASSALYSPANGTAPNAQYDALNRITGFRRGTLSASGGSGTPLDTVTTASTTESWSLDVLGNWSSFSTNGTAQTRSFNARNEITSISGTTTTPTFDNNGNMTEDEQGHKYIYDTWNQIVKVENSGGTVLESYTYDALGRRITATVGSTTTDLYYSTTPTINFATGQVNPATGNVIEERQSGTVTTQYVWGLGYVNALILRDDNSTSGGYGKTSSGLGERIYIQQDANWNVTALVNTSGGVLERFLYDPYGNAAVVTSAWTATTDSYGWLYKFQGGRQDATSNLVRFGNKDGRDYSPTLGRWAEPDNGGGYVNGANLYQAFLGAPISKLDPTGKGFITDPSGGSGGNASGAGSGSGDSGSGGGADYSYNGSGSTGTTYITTNPNSPPFGEDPIEGDPIGGPDPIQDPMIRDPLFFPDDPFSSTPVKPPSDTGSGSQPPDSGSGPPGSGPPEPPDSNIPDGPWQPPSNDDPSLWDTIQNFFGGIGDIFDSGGPIDIGPIVPRFLIDPNGVGSGSGRTIA